MNGQLKSIVIIAILAVGIAAAYIYRKPQIDEPIVQQQSKELWLTGEKPSEVANAETVKAPGRLQFDSTSSPKSKIPESIGAAKSIQQTARAEGFPQPAAPLMKVEQNPRRTEETTHSPSNLMSSASEPATSSHASGQAFPDLQAPNFEPMAQFGSTLSPLDEQSFYQPGDIVPPQINGTRTQSGMVQINPDPVASNQNFTAPQVAYPKNNLIGDTPSRVTIRSLQNSPKLVKHVIRDGDSLKELAARYLGNENRFGEIFQSNRDLLISPEILPIGKRLKIFVD